MLVLKGWNWSAIISLFDIINIFEPRTKLNRCLEEDRYCSRFAVEKCSVGEVYTKIKHIFEDELKRTITKYLLKS